MWQRLPRQSFDLIQACDVLEKAAAGLPGLQELTWPSLRAALSGLAVTDESCTPDGPLHHCGVPLRLCARLALAVVTGDRALVRVGENEIIKEASPRLEWNDAEQVLAPLEDVSANLDAGIGNILPIDTLFISARLPGGGHGRGYLRSSTAIPVQVTKADAEIAYRLRKPDGTWLNVLNIEERLYRPILAPRSWNPVNLTRFRTAMASGEAWRDHPAHVPPLDPETFGTNICLHIDDIAEERAPRTTKELALRNSRMEQIVERCKNFKLVGGIVYRPTPPPVLTLVLTSDRSGTVRWPCKLTWKCGTLRGWSDPDPGSNRYVKTLIGARMSNGNYGPEFESLLRTVAIELEAPDEGPVIADKCDQALSLPPLAEFALNANLWKQAISEMNDAPQKLINASSKAVDEFVAACKSENMKGAKQAAGRVRNTLRKMAPASKRIVKQGGPDPLAPSSYERMLPASNVITAVALANATVQLIGESRRGISDEEGSLIAGAFTD